MKFIIFGIKFRMIISQKSVVFKVHHTHAVSDYQVATEIEEVKIQEQLLWIDGKSSF